MFDLKSIQNNFDFLKLVSYLLHLKSNVYTKKTFKYSKTSLILYSTNFAFNVKFSIFYGREQLLYFGRNYN